MPTGTEPRLIRFAGRKAWHIYDPTVRQRRVSTHTESRTEAEGILAGYIREKAKPPIVSISAILERYLEDRREAGKPGADRLAYAHKPLHRLLGNLPPELDIVTVKRCRDYAKTRRADGVKDATIRTELQALGAALRWATLPDVKLIAEAPRLELPLRPRGRIRWLTREEGDRLIAATRAPHMRLFIEIALRTGVRSGAILALTWDRVNLDRRLIDFREPDKIETRKRQIISVINNRLFPLLEQAKQLATTDYVIEYSGRSIDRVKRAFRETAERAQLADVTPHVLRHTAVTWMLQDGVPVWEAAKAVGMTAAMVEEVYGHHHPDFGRRAAAALE